MLLRSIIAAVLITGSAHAATVVITDERCVAHPALKVHSSQTNYAVYKDIDGSYPTHDTIPFTLTLTPPVKVAAIDMIKSQSKPTSTGLPGHDTDDLVLVEMQPVNSPNTQIFPKMVMNCSSKWSGEKSYSHQCKLLPQYPHYALDDFRSELVATEGGPNCSNGSFLKYTLTLVSNPQHVEAIKDEAATIFQKKFPLVPKDFVKAAVGLLFTEEEFFRQYYTEFYNRWVASIK